MGVGQEKGAGFDDYCSVDSGRDRSYLCRYKVSYEYDPIPGKIR